jgi:hypothetical protein
MRLLFMNCRGRAFNANKVRTLGLHPVLDRLGIPLSGLYAFRHTHSSLLLDVGALIHFSGLIVFAGFGLRDRLKQLRGSEANGSRLFNYESTLYRGRNCIENASRHLHGCV